MAKAVKQMQEELQKEVRIKPAKRVNIVSLKLVKESSLLYKERHIRSPEDGYRLMKHFLNDLIGRRSSSLAWTPRTSSCSSTSAYRQPKCCIVYPKFIIRNSIRKVPFGISRFSFVKLLRIQQIC
ncbi:hypothetical protein ACQCVH_06710 [Bacillus infantis]|uniref:hypothetical protein n=1 Tax=Bacillus infantis TaxID=324767 RepID=UPI003CF5E1EB